MIKVPKFGGLCCRAWGHQTDIQSIGYDYLCALAWLFYDPKEKDASYKAIERAREEINSSSYSYGFQLGWDGKNYQGQDEEAKIGWTDGNTAIMSVTTWKTINRYRDTLAR